MRLPLFAGVRGIVLLVLVCCSSVGAAQGVEVEHSPLDARGYRNLTLANGLKVLLIQDLDADGLDWALSIQAGRATDPLAFPDIHRLAAIVLQEQSQASIDISLSPRYVVFSLPSYARERSLEHVVPLLSPVVASEVSVARAQQGLADTIRAASTVTAQEQRLEVVAALASKQLHGQSVSIAPMASLSPALKDYYRTYYRADRAALAVRSAASLDDMEARVKSLLQVELPIEQAVSGYDNFNFEQDQLPIKAQVASEAESPALYFYFPVANLTDIERNKSFSIFEYLLTRRGPGSLVALLRSLGWAKQITLDFKHKPGSDGFAVVNIELTRLGVRASNQVEALLYYVIDNIKRQGLDAWRFQELARAERYEFLYRDAFAEHSLIALANRLQSAAPGKALSQSFDYGKFEPLSVQRAMAALRPDNVITLLVDESAETDRFAGHSHTPYRVVEANDEHPDIKPEIKRRLFLPDANKFIPQKLTAKSSQLLPSHQIAAGAKPVELIDRPQLTAWYQTTGLQASPDASLFLRLVTQGADASARQAVDTLLSVYLLAEKLAPALDHAQRAGMEYLLRPTVLGVDVEISGYNSQLGLFLTQFGRVYDEPMKVGDNLTRAIAWLKAELNDNGPLGRTFTDPFILWQYEPYWSRWELLEALNSLEPETWRYNMQVKSLQMLAAGSLYRQEAQRLAALAELALLDNDSAPPAPARLVVADQGQPHGLERRAGELELYLQSGSSDAKDFVFIRAVAALLNGELINVSDEPGEAEGVAVAIRAQRNNMAGVAALSLATSGDVLTGPLLEALQRRLAEPDIGPRLAELKRQWRAEAPDKVEAHWHQRHLWRTLVNPVPDNDRASVAALNSASVERYVERLFAANIYLMSDGDGAREHYSRSFTTAKVGVRLPLEFPPLVIE
ncbi:insulinase family protein [Gilvimarinus sp. SDUM040013]|uniref:Protease 3 n=1 Tax=Gilvimarinus gilvus TaxID=3058038 RepID=A0ABU4S0N6_9GAMM|nr:insulinase family protein [Gilvimarinus sp. SDUM040013]MDO3386305.1 insulinase family protein [Gilvimarinus sp. SDUM040013]MDX6850037.1 insulinase family protein [Gilvimarinus sp. SDUM040013]